MTPYKTHNKTIGYILWLFGILGVHRFYYGRPVTGTIWLCTLGVFGIGWIIDLFLIPAMNREVDCRFISGQYDYSAAWLLLVLLGYTGAHRFYIGNWKTGVLYLLTLGICFIGVLYDVWIINQHLSRRNRLQMHTDALYASVY